MTKKNRILTEINIGMITVTLLSIILGLTIDDGFFGLAFGSFLSIIPVYQLDMVSKISKKAVLGGFAVLFTGLGVGIILASIMNAEIVSGLWLGLLISSVAFTWISSLMHR